MKKLENIEKQFIYEEGDNETLNMLCELIDMRTSNDSGTIIDYINECNRTRNINRLGDYYELELPETDNFNYNSDDLLKMLKRANIKGLRDNTPRHELIKAYLKTSYFNCYNSFNDIDFNEIVNKEYQQYISPEKKLLVWFGNDAITQFTASYSDIVDFGSCFDFRSGGYRDSVLAFMNEPRSYIIKFFIDDETNRKLAETDELKFSSTCIARIRIETNNEFTCFRVGKVYGDKSFEKRLTKEFYEELFGYKLTETSISLHLSKAFNDACSSDVMYNETRNGVADYRIADCEINDVINNYCDFDNDDMDELTLSNNNYCLCCYECGCILDRYDEPIYIDGDCYCSDCARYDDSADEWFSVNEHYVIIDGEYYCDRFHDIGRY